MGTANEELLAMNEQLQSKNEELETAREEQESLNEELKATNVKLQSKYAKLCEANADLENLMAASEIATLFLNRDLEIYRYTPRTSELFHVEPSDVGRKLGDFGQWFEYAGLIDDAKEVLETLDPGKQEIRTTDGRWFLARLRPYLTLEGEVDGVVISFVEITGRKQREKTLRSQAKLDAFRVELADAIRPLADPIDIQQEAARVLGESLDVDRACYAEVVGDGAEIRVYTDHCKDHVDSLVGEHDLAEYGAYILDGVQGGALVVGDDCAAISGMSEADRLRHEQANITAWIGVPLHKDGEFIAYVAVTDSDSREWTDLEVAMVDETVDRTWAAMERARAEEALRESEECLDAFVTATAEVVSRMRPDWSKMIYLDGKGFVADTEEPRQAWLEDYIPDHEKERVTEAIEEAIETKSPFEMEHQVTQADGTVGWVYARAVPILNEDGEILEWFGTSTDITERRKIEQAVVDAAEDVRRDIAQELHDVLSSDLATATMKTGNLKDQLEQQGVEEAEELE